MFAGALSLVIDTFISLLHMSVSRMFLLDLNKRERGSYPAVAVVMAQLAALA